VSPIVVSETVRVPASAMTVRASRASGPGGQNVNKVATKTPTAGSW
jgi:ribosome-associated protein